jgi:hypothetical protein
MTEADVVGLSRCSVIDAVAPDALFFRLKRARHAGCPRRAAPRVEAH